MLRCYELLGSRCLTTTRVLAHCLVDGEQVPASRSRVVPFVRVARRDQRDNKVVDKLVVVIHAFSCGGYLSLHGQKNSNRSSDHEDGVLKK